MYGQLRRDDTAEGERNAVWQKPSPSSGDDATKEHTQNTTEGANNRYARKKCGLKPIRPAAMSTSSLNPNTPGKLPQTPRMSYKENEHQKLRNSEFPATPKFSRSESTPELHRTRKMDYLLMSTEKTGTFEKTRNTVLQENQGSNLLNLASDSLPDILCKPIGQSHPNNQILSKSTVAEEKVSKWGYGPAAFSSRLSNTKTNSESTKETNLKHIIESSNHAKPIKEIATPLKSLPSLTPVFTSRKVDFPSLNMLDKQSSLSNLAVTSTDGANKCADKSDLSLTSDTANTLGLSNQLTVKICSQEKQPPPPAKSSSLNPTSYFPLGNRQTNAEPPSVSPVILSQTSPKTKNTVPDSQDKHQALESSSSNDDAPICSKPIGAPALKPLHNLQTPTPLDNAENHNKLPVVHNIFQPPTHRPPHKIKQLNVNGKCYSIMKPLGRGGSSVVFQVLNPEMTDVYALKVVRLDSIDEGTAEGYINEVRLLKRLQCLPRVVRLLDFEYNEDEEKLLLVMERGDTDFATVVRNRTNANDINPTLVRFYWQEMLEAVKEIHEQNVIHSDLKPANFLLVNGGLKLIDFGIATSIQSDMTSIVKDSQCGTYNYMAPEAIKSVSTAGANQEYKISRKTDVWSLGCILYSLIYKSPPFSKFRDTIEKINAIIDERHVIEFPAYSDPMAVEVAKACLDRNPRKRPTIQELLSHPYLSCSTAAPVVTPSLLRARLEPFMVDGKLSEETKVIIRQWI